MLCTNKVANIYTVWNWYESKIGLKPKSPFDGMGFLKEQSLSLSATT